MKTRVLPILLCAFLNGCGPTIWDKPGLTQQEFQKDAYECQRDANIAGAGYNGQGFLQGAVVGNTREQCMMARGYTKQSK